MLERRTVSHNLLEIRVAPDFFFEIELLLGKFLLQFGNLAEGQAILDSDGYLAGRFLEKIDLIRQEGIIGAAVNGQSSHDLAAADKRYHTLSPQPLRYQQLV